jgi:hypothetical protein
MANMMMGGAISSQSHSHMISVISAPLRVAALR